MGKSRSPVRTKNPGAKFHIRKRSVFPHSVIFTDKKTELRMLYNFSNTPCPAGIHSGVHLDSQSKAPFGKIFSVARVRVGEKHTDQMIEEGKGKGKLDAEWEGK